MRTLTITSPASPIEHDTHQDSLRHSQSRLKSRTARLLVGAITALSAVVGLAGVADATPNNVCGDWGATLTQGQTNTSMTAYGWSANCFAHNEPYRVCVGIYRNGSVVIPEQCSSSTTASSKTKTVVLSSCVVGSNYYARTIINTAGGSSIGHVSNTIECICV